MRAVAKTPRRDTAIIVYQSSNREGSTFSLLPESLQTLQAQFGDKLHAVPRVFIAHEVRSGRGAPDLRRLHGRLLKPLLALLTGLDDDSIDQLEGIELRDPVTDTPV